jgi:hypothetical protein
VDELLRTDPTLEPIYRSDTSEYAPLAGSVLLRVGSRQGYEALRVKLLERLSVAGPLEAGPVADRP